QQPIACISSYYDPTDSTTALNEDELLWNTDPNGKSNNGIVYKAPTTRATRPELAEQANMVFPDGRFANEPLRRALERLSNGGDLTLEEQAAIDSTLCSLEILDYPLSFTNNPGGVTIPHGVIREVTLLDARQIKAIDDDDPNTTVDETFTLNSPLTPDPQSANLTTNYDLALEERQPLEIRLTQLDLNQMRNQTITPLVTTGPSPEYLLPNSGIIYATRDDALPDRSDRRSNGNGIDEDASKAISPTDYKLDPTRRPNGIMLINGQRLARNDDNDNGQNDDNNDVVSSIEDVVKEKGLTLVTNLPVYIHGQFNPHGDPKLLPREEFTQLLDDDWDNFYGRTENQINPNFACRAGDPRIRGCSEGDSWRAATVLADAITLLSDDNDYDDDGNPNDDDGNPNNDSYDNITLGFRPGFRNEGDFDLRNNAGNLPVVANDFDGDNIADAGYDFDGTPGNEDTATVDETQLGFDLDGVDQDGDGDFADNTAVLEEDITVAGARMLNGFYGNNFVTNGLSSQAFDANGDQVAFDPANNLQDTNYSTNNGTAINSSYFNNYVTPVQRRGQFPEYVMEMCRKLPVSSCQPPDWFVGADNGTGGGTANNDIIETDEQLQAADVIGEPANILGAGTTARPALDPNDRRYPRRIAFARDNNFNLILDGNGAIPIGVGGGNVNVFPPYNTVTIITGTVPVPSLDGTYNAGLPDIAPNALWFRTSNDATNPTAGENYGNTHPLAYLEPLAPGGTVQQPLLVPVLQNYVPTNTPQGDQGNLPNPNNNTLRSNSRWLTRASGDTTFNLVVGSGDVPPRPPETNGGLQNLPRFLENWAQDNNNNFATNIIGSFMQLNRSAYATAPYPHVPPNGINDQRGANSLFGFRGSYKTNNYTVNNNGARVGYFLPPDRSWGFDVGLLSQSPDYFSQQLSGEDSSGEPDKYYREVSLDDEWVETLLCSQVIDDDGQVVENAANDNYRQNCN
ncbi:hormogonium polysaccharide biosynthesis protein HpsA, partial [Hydrocoleum sp. CS-953]